MQTEIEYRNTKMDVLIFSWRSILRHKIALASLLGIVLLGTISVFKGHDLDIVTVLAAIMFSGIIFAALFLFMLVYLSLSVLITYSAKNSKNILAKHRMVLTKEGCSIESENRKGDIRWAGVNKIRKGRWHIYLYIGPDNAHIIPKRAFNSSVEYDAFYDVLQMFRSSSASLCSTSSG